VPVCATVEKFKVVILYERLSYVSRAMATCRHLMRELEDDYAPDFCLWRIENALTPAWAAEAERDIAAAEVIIMAVDGRQRCPLAFQRWKGGAGHEGGQPPHAIISLMAASDDSSPEAGSWSNVLRGTATQINSEVFVCEAAVINCAAEPLIAG